MPPIDVSVSAAETHVLVTVVGELDMDSHEQFTSVAVPATEQGLPVVLDLTAVGFIDSIGIGALARVRQELADRDRPAHVVPSRRVLAALKLTGLTEVFTVHETVADAVGAAADGGP